jgi:hypothetical protein
MEQRCTDLDRFEEDKISCEIYLGCARALKLIKAASCDFYDPVRTGDSSSLSSDGVSLSEAKNHCYSSRQTSLCRVGLASFDIFAHDPHDFES